LARAVVAGAAVWADHIAGAAVPPVGAQVDTAAVAIEELRGAIPAALAVEADLVGVAGIPAATAVGEVVVGVHTDSCALGQLPRTLTLTGAADANLACAALLATGAAVCGVEIEVDANPSAVGGRVGAARAADALLAGAARGTGDSASATVVGARL